MSDTTTTPATPADPVEELLAGKRLFTEQLPVVKDQVWLAEQVTAAQKVERLRSGIESGRLTGENLAVVEQQLAEAEAVLAEVESRRGPAVIEFELLGLSSYEYDLLLKEHKPTPEQRKAASLEGQVPMWNTETFPAALVAACVVGPTKLTADQVARMFEDPRWSAGDTLAMIQMAEGLCTWRRSPRSVQPRKV